MRCRKRPVTANTPHDGGAATTNVVVQYAGDGIADPHYLYRQSDAVKHQYACFFETYLKTGQATVRAATGGDAPLLMGIALTTLLFVFAGNLLADIAARLADPRLQRERAR